MRKVPGRRFVSLDDEGQSTHTPAQAETNVHNIAQGFLRTKEIEPMHCDTTRKKVIRSDDRQTIQ